MTQTIDYQSGTEDDAFASSLTLTEEQIAASGWTGSAITDIGAVLVTIFECPSVKGHYHCVVIGRSVTETNRPVTARGVGVTLDYFLSTYHQCKAADIRWRKVEQPIATKDEAHADKSNEVVYFLRAGGFIKIGKSTYSGRRRIAELQTGCPYPIEFIGQIKGGQREERVLHRQFAHIRAHGEWFHATEQLLAHIDLLKVAA